MHTQSSAIGASAGKTQGRVGVRGAVNHNLQIQQIEQTEQSLPERPERGRGGAVLGAAGGEEGGECETCGSGVLVRAQALPLHELLHANTDKEQGQGEKKESGQDDCLVVEESSCPPREACSFVCNHVYLIKGQSRAILALAHATHCSNTKTLSGLFWPHCYQSMYRYITVYMYMCMYTCRYIYIYKCMHISTSVYAYIHVYTYIYPCIYLRICICTVAFQAELKAFVASATATATATSTCDALIREPQSTSVPRPLPLPRGTYISRRTFAHLSTYVCMGEREKVRERLLW